VCSVVLLVAALLALFAYVIVPDETKDANRQVPAMALQFPGTHQQYALIERLSTQKEQQSLIDRYVFGSTDAYEYLPYDSLVYHDNQVIIHHTKNYQLRHYDTGQVRIPMVEMCLVD